MIFIAYKSSVCFLLTKYTRPKAPFPIRCKKSKFSIPISFLLLDVQIKFIILENKLLQILIDFSKVPMRRRNYSVTIITFEKVFFFKD